MVKALGKIIGECPDAKIVILGRVMDKPYFERVLSEIEELNLGHAVLLAGYDENAVPWYQAADAFLLPSFWEGWSLALAEALNTGLPVIATDVGGAADVIAETGGYLVPPPFKSITELDATNMWQYLDGDNLTFVDELAACMKKAYIERPRIKLSPEFRHSIQRSCAYDSYSRLFQWVIQKGAPNAARTWGKIRMLYPTQLTKCPNSFFHYLQFGNNI